MARVTDEGEPRGALPLFVRDWVGCLARDNPLGRSFDGEEQIESLLLHNLATEPRPNGYAEWAGVWMRTVRQVTSESGRVLERDRRDGRATRSTWKTESGS